ncbi:hypothetical protein [Saccharopolyspora taberi]|uniref:Uncharacterized protein n=1 Tax=Saccharopolyspora taberi TaxID=60895 RepID=A0ABN3VCV8_9PSEU
MRKTISALGIACACCLSVVAIPAAATAVPEQSAPAATAPDQADRAGCSRLKKKTGYGGWVRYHCAPSWPDGHAAWVKCRSFGDGQVKTVTREGNRTNGGNTFAHCMPNEKLHFWGYHVVPG